MTFSFKERRLKSESTLPNTYVCQYAFDASSGGMWGLHRDGDELSRTDLDSHTNVVVVCKHAAIINDTGNRNEVSPFSQEYESLSKVTIVDPTIRYDFPYSGETH